MMSAGPSKATTPEVNLRKVIAILNQKRTFDSVDARQRELDAQRKRNRARQKRASSAFPRSDLSSPDSSRSERGHSVAGPGHNPTVQCESSERSFRAKSLNRSIENLHQAISTSSSSSAASLNTTAPGNLLDLHDKTSAESEPSGETMMSPPTSSSSAPSTPATSDDSLFVKPALPSITRLKPRRVFSSRPISSSRLTVPKRRFSPEPEKKQFKGIPGYRKPLPEMVHLSELKRIFDMLPIKEFELPVNFKSKSKKRQSTTSSTISDELSTSSASPISSPIPVALPERKSPECGVQSVKEESGAPSVKEESISSAFPTLLAVLPSSLIVPSEVVDFSLPASLMRNKQKQNEDDDEKKSAVRRPSRRSKALQQQQQQQQQQQSPRGGLKLIKFPWRKRRRSESLRKSHEKDDAQKSSTDTESGKSTAALEQEVAVTSKIANEKSKVVKGRPKRKVPKVEPEPEGRGRKRVEGKKSSDAGKSEETSEGGVVSTSDEMIECGRKLEVKRESAENNVEERRLEKSLKLMQRTDSRAQQGVSTAYSDDDDEDSKLHIVETADDDENTSLEEGVEAGNLREQSGQTPAHEAAVAASATTPSNKMSKRGGDDRIQTQQCTTNALETSKPISTVAFELIEDVIRKVCEELDESSDTLTGTQSAQSSSALITEPLRRRPGESRIVAPLRIRIKQVARKAREPRERRPARSKDYSPPGWGSTHSKHKPQDNSNQLSLTQALNALSQQKPSTSRGSRKSLTPSAIVNSSPAAIRTSARQRRNALKQATMQSEESVSTPDVLCLDADVTAEESNVSEKRLSSITRTPCTAETIRARIKESEGLIADIGSFATQFYNESDFSSGRMSVSKHQDDNAEGFKLQVKEEQQDGDDGPSEPKDQPPETSQDGNATVGQSDGRPQRRKSVNYTRLYPELFPSKRRRRKSVRSVISDDEPINSTSASVVEKHSPPIIPIPFEQQQQQQPPKGRKRSSRGKKDATLASILSSPGSDVARPDYNEMADSPMLSASERRRQKKSQQRSSHKKSTDSTTNEESLAQEDSEAATVNTPDQQLTEADGKEEPQNEMVELAAVSVAEETDMKDDSTLMVLKRKHDGSSAERKSRRSSDCNAKLSVSLSAEMGQQTPNDSEGTVSATVKPAQNLQMVTRSRARSGPFSVAKVGASSRRSTSKSVDDEVQEITPGVVESKESVESAVSMPAKAQKRSKKATNSVSATAAAATATLQSTSATSVSESAIKQEEEHDGDMVSNGADSKTESISKETKSRPQQPSRMPYFKRISLRKKLNPLAIGLKSRMDDEDAIDFYREILLRGEDIKKPDETQEFEVDIETLPAIESDEVVADNPAIVIACALNVIQPRPTELNDESGEKEEIGLERIHNLASKENDLRRQSLRKVFNIITSQYTAELATEHVMGGASIQYNTLMKNSYRLRDSLPIFSKTRCDAAKWTHKILIECLPVPMLATYISLLRFCKTSSRPLVDLLVGEETDDEQLKTLNSKLTDFIFDRVTDPQTASISRTLNKRCIDNVYVIAVSPSISHADYRSKEKSHDYIFKTLLPNVVGEIEQVRIALPLQSKFSVCEAAEFAVNTVAAKVREVRKKRPHMKLVLAGWGTSCVVNHQVVNQVPHVSAILNFAFPLRTAEGMRGDVDDDILLTYCPSLFIIGEEALDCDVVEMQRMAYRMKAPAGVIVIGSADNNLHVNVLRLCIERFTQRTVERALLDDIVDFMERYCSRTSKNVLPLRPILPRETNDVDLSIFKGSSNSNFSPRYVPAAEKRELQSTKLQGKRPFIDCAHDETVFKRPHNAETVVVEASGSVFLDNAHNSAMVVQERSNSYEQKNTAE